MVAKRSNPREDELARQSYLRLIGMASERKTTTYKPLAGKLGTHHRRMGEILAKVMAWCAQQKPKLPPLTALVVGWKGRPGPGLITSRERDREKVFKYSWFTKVTPTAELLRRAYETRDELKNVFNRGGP